MAVDCGRVSKVPPDWSAAQRQCSVLSYVNDGDLVTVSRPRPSKYDIRYCHCL